MTNSTTIVALALSVFVGAVLHAQCSLEAAAGAVAPGPNHATGFFTSVLWDPDGNGPRSAVLVLGGSFTLPSVGATNLVQYDLGTRRWHAFPAAPDQTVQSLCVDAQGDLLVGGNFTQIGNLPLAGLARFDGQSWSSVANGMPSAGGRVLAMQIVQGDLYVGGVFTTFGGVAANGLARWDGSTWQACGAFAGAVYTMAWRVGGGLVVGGAFPAIGQPGFANIAEFDGAAWRHYGSGLGNNYAYTQALAALPNGDVVASGFFNLAGGVACNRIARWNGTAWSAMDLAFDGPGSAMLVLANGDLLTPVMTASQVPVLGIGRWTGSQWVSHAPGIGMASHLRQLPDGRLLALGSLDTQGGARVRSAAIWDGSTWQALGEGFDAAVTGIAAMPQGDVVVWGPFGSAGGQSISRIARWNGQRWWSMHSAAAPVPWTGVATCSTFDALGRLWVAGNANSTGAGSQSSVGIWTGAGWQTFGIAIGGITSILLPPDQVPILGCATYPGYGHSIVRWNGVNWQRIGNGLDGPVRTLLLRRNGDLIAGGEFLNSGTTPMSRIARWDGTTWSPLGTGVDGPVRALAELPNGDLVAAGDFITDGLDPLNLVARWDGTTWHMLGTGLAGDPGVSARALLVLPDGDLLVGGSFLTAGGQPARGLARWNGSQWSAVAGGVGGSVHALAQAASGEVYVGGDFGTVGVVDSAHFARLATPCPATAQRVGVACPGSAGLVELEATAQPWIGGIYRSTCYGLPPLSLGLDVFGLVPAQTSLASLHPAGIAGCLLLTQPTAITLRLPTNGAVESSFTLPREPLLVGVNFYQQVLVGELGTGGGLARLAGSNGLTLVIGAL